MNQRLNFDAALDQNVLDRTARLIYADWLDDQGEPDDLTLAFAQRWMAGHTQAPAWRVPYMGSRVTKPWAWYPFADPTEVRAPFPARLPYQVFITLTRSQYFVGHKFYRSRIEAERDLAEGLLVLKEMLELQPRNPIKTCS